MPETAVADTGPLLHLTEIGEVGKLTIFDSVFITAQVRASAPAARIRPDVVLSDDLDLRRALESQGFTVVGSIGVLFRALRTGRLRKRGLLARLDDLLDDSSLYTSKAFRITVRRIVDELPPPRDGEGCVIPDP